MSATMTMPAPPVAPFTPPVTAADLFRLTLDQYHQMITAGILTSDDRVELLDGLLVAKMSINQPHRVASYKVRKALEAVLPAGWHVSVQVPVTLDDCEPEPDAAVVRGEPGDYDPHPQSNAVALVAEASDSSLARDREWKRHLYARNGIPVYWIVNLVDRTLEVYTNPSGPAPVPDYAAVRVLTAADRADVVLNGTVVGTVAVADLIP